MSAGCLCIMVAGFYKATWKLLYYLNVCDFVALNQAFFPMQATGFVLLGLAFISLFKFKQDVVYTVALYQSKMIFVLFTLFGTVVSWLSLARIAKKMKLNKVAIMLVVSLICMLMMGYLSSKDFSNPLFNWIGELTNILGLGLYYYSLKIMDKNNLAKFNFKEH